MYSIYALVDPRDHTTRYVGVTKDVYRRFVQHIQCDGINHRKDAWIQELREANQMVLMETLQQASSAAVAQEREIYWIHHFLELGMPLYNASIPNPLHVRRIRHKPSVKLSQDEICPPSRVSSTKAQAVHELLEHGYGRAYIIKTIWDTSPGDTRKYAIAKQEFEQILNAQDKVARIRELQANGLGQKQILYQLWGVLPGGNTSTSYQKAREEYRKILFLLNTEEME